MKLLIGFCLLFTTNSFCQNYLLENEAVVYSFDTNNGKKLMIAVDTNERYLIYRYGTKALIELEYPNKLKGSWKKFNFSYYMRGGGIENAGMDINFLYFYIGDYQYVVYDTYYSEPDESNCGIKVINKRTNEETNIVGDINTVKGSMSRILFWNELITIGEETFD
jgi:hypothetical protein